MDEVPNVLLAQVGVLRCERLRDTREWSGTKTLGPTRCPGCSCEDARGASWSATHDPLIPTSCRIKAPLCCPPACCADPTSSCQTEQAQQTAAALQCSCVMPSLEPSLQEWVRLEKLDADEVAVHPRYPVQLTSHPAAATVTTAPAPQTPFVPPQQVATLAWLALSYCWSS